MLNRVLILLVVGAGLAACQPAIPDSAPNRGQGVGFDRIDAQERQQRDAALAGSVPAPASVSTAPLSGVPADGSAEATAAETRRVLAATGSTAAAANSGVEPVQASPSNPPPAVLNEGGISQENSFDAVSSRRGIEGDAARIAANRAQYQTIQPEALPTRGNTGPNIVAYVQQNTHPVGTRVYRRGVFATPARQARACAQYGRPVLAQIAFLERGGPERDRAGLDADGDGFACTWDPTPFRNTSGG